jgi:hypothetical protein
MINKEACIIATGEWGGSRVLFKNRDRNYLPPLKVYHEVINSVEILYYKDELTGWTEGMNEYGIGLVNAALSVDDDEKEKNRVTNPKIVILNKDPKKVLKALQQKTLDDAVEVICDYLGGLTGHTFVSDGLVTKSIELTKEHGCIVKTLRNGGIHVRTNHGINHEEAGYQEGVKRDSSVMRRNRAIRKLKEVQYVEDVAPTVYGYRVGKDPFNPLNMVRDSKEKIDMKSTSQVVMDLSNKKMYFYLIPRKVKFLGYYKNNNVKKPKCELSVIKYTGIREDGTFDMDIVDTLDYGIKDYIPPSKRLASQMIRTAMLKKDILSGLNPEVKKKAKF